METIKYKNYNIKIEQDDCPENPRAWDNMGTLYLNNYGSDDSIKHDEESMLVDILAEEEVTSYDQGWLQFNIDKARKNLEKYYLFLPVYKYEHGGVAYNTSGFSCGWDSGQAGFIVISKEDIRKIYNVKRISSRLKERVLSILESEVEIFSQYANGDVYGFTIEQDEFHDSCWGFFGDDHDASGLMATAQEIIDYHLAQKAKQKQAKIKQLIKNKVALIYRAAQLETI